MFFVEQNIARLVSYRKLLLSSAPITRMKRLRMSVGSIHFRIDPIRYDTAGTRFVSNIRDRNADVPINCGLETCSDRVCIKDQTRSGQFVIGLVKLHFEWAYYVVAEIGWVASGPDLRCRERKFSSHHVSHP